MTNGNDQSRSDEYLFLNLYSKHMRVGVFERRTKEAF